MVQCPTEDLLVSSAYCSQDMLWNDHDPNKDEVMVEDD